MPLAVFEFKSSAVKERKLLKGRPDGYATICHNLWFYSLSLGLRILVVIRMNPYSAFAWNDRVVVGLKESINSGQL